MTKFLFVALLLSALFVSVPDVEAKVVNACPNDTSVQQRVGATGTKNAANEISCPQETDICYKKRSTGIGDIYDCYIKSPLQVGQAGEPAPCIGDCTKGAGLQCSTTQNGKLVAKDGDGIMTAIGCIPSKPQILIESILKYTTLASGGIAFLLMILAALSMMTAEGNPEIIKKAQERFYSAIIGLLLIIFAVLLMQVIGVDLLGLKGFSSV